MCRPQCRTCKYSQDSIYTFERYPQDVLLCRRHAPSNILKTRIAMWSIVKDDDWCGEYECDNEKAKRAEIDDAERAANRKQNINRLMNKLTKEAS